MIKSDLEKTLTEGPDEVAKALLDWRVATADREKSEAKLYLRLKVENPDSTATELRHMVNASDERYHMVLHEAGFESVYQAKYEKLLSAKKEASMRVAY